MMEALRRLQADLARVPPEVGGARRSGVGRGIPEEEGGNPALSAMAEALVFAHELLRDEAAAVRQAQVRDHGHRQPVSQLASRAAGLPGARGGPSRRCGHVHRDTTQSSG
jgi:hypothetical protein